jgi:hypothetical protein
MTLAPEVERPVRRPSPATPYVGLVPFGEDDAQFFFGRSQEVAIVTANLRSSRLTLVYGPSGVGKSSLLQAGVVHGLRRDSLRAHDGAPFAICTYRSWLEDPVRGLTEAAHAALQELAADEPLAPPAATLAESLEAWTGQAGTLLVVLDQFEEYFLYHDDETPGGGLKGFGAELARIVDDRALDVHVLLSIREDAWSRLDRFEGHIPALFLNYLRVDHLDRVAGREAIEGPVGSWNRTHPQDPPYYVEPALVDAVLAAATGDALAGAAGVETGGAADRDGDGVEAPFLQLVLERVWRATVESDTRVLSLATLEELGGAKAIVERHLLEALGGLTRHDQDVASDCFRFLVSRERTKRAQPAADLAAWTGRRRREITAVLGVLCTAESGRILRAIAPVADGGQGPSYELFHDVLAEPVLAWRRRHEAERARRRLLRVGAAALALVAIFAGLAAWALAERHHTQQLLDARNASNAALARRYASLLRQTSATRARDLRIRRQVTTLSARNRSLTGETAALVKTRNGLTVQVRTLRVQNGTLAHGLRTLNAQNAALAKQINDLLHASVDLESQLGTLQDEQDQLRTSSGVLEQQQAALDAESSTLDAENTSLERKAEELGRAVPAVPTVQASGAVRSSAVPTIVARQYDVPGDTAGSDALRRHVEALGQRLLALRTQRTRLADQESWYAKANGLLVQQRAALRVENAHLVGTLAIVKARNGVLVANSDLAKAQHARLAKERAGQRATNARTSKQVEAARRAESKLEQRAVSQIGDLGASQDDIAKARTRNTKLVNAIGGPVARLVAAARNPQRDAKLAGLLAVLAYRLDPYAADDPAHPDVYNALWLTLNRLDPTAAHGLIAPSSRATAQIGTTTGAKLARAVCGHAAGTLTRDEWAEFLPPEAPYARSVAAPCG